MKSKLLSLTFLLLISSTIYAQEEGETFVSLTGGVANLGGAFEFQKVLQNNLAVGIYGSLTDINSKYYSYSKDKLVRNPDFDMGVKVFYYLDETLELDEKMNLYIAAGGGVRVYKDWGLFDYLYEDNPSLKFRIRTIVRGGLDYAVSENALINIEVGKGPSWVSGGIKFRLSN